MKHKLPLKTGDIFQCPGLFYEKGIYTVQYLFSLGRLRMVCVIRMGTTTRMHMVMDKIFVHPPVTSKPKTGWSRLSNAQVIKSAFKGNKQAVKEYIKRFKKLPKIKR